MSTRYSVEQVDEPLYSMLVKLGMTDIAVDDYDIMASSDMDTVSQYVDAMMNDPIAYPWDAVLYTLKESLPEGALISSAKSGSAALQDPTRYSVEQVDEPLYSMLVKLGLTDIAAEDYDVLASSDMDTVSQYVDAMMNDPIAYPWDAVLYTLKESLDAAEQTATEAQRATPSKKTTAGERPRRDTVTDDSSVAPVPECDFTGGSLDTGADGKWHLTLGKSELPDGGKCMIAEFKVKKSNPSARLVGTGKKERLFVIDGFNRQFKNCNLDGTATFTIESDRLYRADRSPTDPCALRLFFFKADHPMDIDFASGAERQRFLQLAALHRRHPVMWSPMLCRNSSNEVGVTIQAPTASLQPLRLSATRHPYETMRVHVCSMDLSVCPLSGIPREVMARHLPPNEFDVYIVGLLHNGKGSAGKGAEEALAKHFGPSYYVALNTAMDNHEFAGLNASGTRAVKGVDSAVAIVAKKSTLPKLSNFDFQEIGSAAENGGEKKSHAVFATMRIQESTVAVMLANIPVHLSTVEKNDELQRMLHSVPCGDPRVDVATRFDYFFLVGPVGYKTSPRDELYPQIDGQMILSEFQECTVLQDDRKVGNPQANHHRVLFYNRPKCTKASVLEYATTRDMLLANVRAEFDLYALRPYGFALGAHALSTARSCRVKLTAVNCSLDGVDSGDLSGAVLTPQGSWFEPVQAPIPFVPSHGPLQPEIVAGGVVLQPFCPTFEWLKSQALLLSVCTPGKVAPLATAVVPLRGLIQANSSKSNEMTVSFVQRSVVVGSAEVELQLLMS